MKAQSGITHIYPSKNDSAIITVSMHDAILDPVMRLCGPGRVHPAVTSM